MAQQQSVTLSGKITDRDNGEPVEFASVLIKDNGLWAMTDADGKFSIRQVPTGKAVLTVQCLGYATYTTTLNITKSASTISIQLQPENLKLEEVTVVARRKRDEATTSYTIDRTDRKSVV